jgi:hypothetical protein
MASVFPASWSAWRRSGREPERRSPMAVTRSVLPWPRRPASLTFPTQFAATCSSDLFGRLYYAKTRFASVGKGPDTSVVIPVAIIGTCRGMTLGAHPGRSAAAFQARLSYKRGEMHGPLRLSARRPSPQRSFPKADGVDGSCSPGVECAIVQLSRTARKGATR